METNDNRKSAEDKGYTDKIYEIRFLPVMERPEYASGPVHDCLLKLKEAMGEKDFDTYINRLIRITYTGDRLLLITKAEIHRTLLSGRFYQLICDAFSVSDFRVVSEIQGY